MDNPISVEKVALTSHCISLPSGRVKMDASSWDCHFVSGLYPLILLSTTVTTLERKSGSFLTCLLTLSVHSEY
jgi:hypothetical protein